MLDAQSDVPRRRRLAATAAAAALASAMIAPALATGPATATPTCQALLPYGASASADLLRLSALDLRPLGLGIGPVADVSVATTGAGMAADAEVASAAAARDVAANLLGLDALGLVPAGGLGRTVFQEAPPTNADPSTHTGIPLDLGVAAVNVGNTSAHATWDQGMRCGAVTGTAARSAASLVDAAVLPGSGDQALLRLPDNLSSRAETGLVEASGHTASQAEAAASLAQLQLFAGSESEINIRVISEPRLEVVSTGHADTSTVSYQAPVLEISGSDLTTARLAAPGQHVDLALPGSLGELDALTSTLPLAGSLVGGLPLVGELPLSELLGGLADGTLAGVTSGSEEVDRPLELDHLLGIGGGQLPLLGDVLGDEALGSLLPDLTGLSLLRISVGELQQDVTDELVRASAASLRVQVLAWDGEQLTEQTYGQALLDLGVGLLEAAATAPAPPPPPDQEDPGDPEEPGQGGGCGDDCDGGKLPVTGSTAGIVVGAGTLLALAGRFLLLVSRRGWLTAGS